MPFTPADYTELRTKIFGVPELQAEETANDSDKTLTVPAGETWEIQSLWVELATTATAGNRTLTVELQDDANDVIASIAAGAVQSISITRLYIFGPGLPDLTSFRGPSSNMLMTPIPRIILPAGYQVRVYDAAAVDAAADDMIVQMLVQVRTP